VGSNPTPSAIIGAMMKQVLAIIGMTALLSACSDTCGNTVVSKADAPDGQHTAIMFQRDCGATTGFSTQVSVLESGETPSGSGNVFSADDGHGAARAGNWGGPWASIKWLSADRLLIRYAQKSRIFEQADETAGVQITYKVD
jgi:hypothetical protein